MPIEGVKVYLATSIAFAIILQHDDQIYFLETEWFQQYWTVSWFIGVLYLLAIFIGQRCISTPIKHKRCLRYWNFMLTVFSICGTYRVGKEFLETLTRKGLVATYCNDDYYNQRSVYFWYCLFVLSKCAEMVDTYFLVASGKPVRLIHWSHHSITMIYSFYIASYLPAIGRWMSTMNFVVHSAMYAYYWATSCGVRIARPIARMITTMQTTQMLLGLVVILLAFHAQLTGVTCHNGGYTVQAALFMYIFYVYLFVQLLIKSFNSSQVKSKTQ